jgi:hypothetical protein
MDFTTLQHKLQVAIIHNKPKSVKYWLKKANITEIGAMICDDGNRYSEPTSMLGMAKRFRNDEIIKIFLEHGAKLLPHEQW